jgi:hypothetical protein
MPKVKYCGPEDHIVVFLDQGATKFKLNEIKEVSEISLPKLLALPLNKFIKVEEVVAHAEAKVLPTRSRNRQLPKAEVKNEPEL